MEQHKSLTQGRRPLTYRSLIIIVVMVLMLAYFFVQSRGISVQKNQQFNSHINAVLAGNAKLNQLLIKTRYKLINNTDPINQTFRYIKYHTDVVLDLFAQLPHEANGLLDKHIEQEIQLYADKTELAEQFVSHNAVLKNSFFYVEKLLFEAYESVVSQQDLAKGQWQTVERIKALERLLVFPHLHANHDSQAEQTEIFDLIDALDTQGVMHMASIRNHAQLILATKFDVDADLARLIRNNYTLGLNFQEGYADLVTADKRRSQLYVWLLLLLIVILLGYSIHSFTTIRRMILSLKNQQYALDQHAIVSITDSKGDITYVNALFEKISGYDRSELLGKNHRMIKSDEHSPAFFGSLWRTITHGRVWHGQVKNFKKNGGSYWVNATVVPLYNMAGKIDEYISIRTDITAQKTLEATLKEAKLQAEAGSKAKSDFIATMSHEIRTPMNGIMGMTDLLLETKLNEEQQDYLGAVKYSAEALMTLLNDILDFSKIEAGKFELDIHPFSLAETCKGAVMTFTAMAKQKGIDLNLNMADNLPSHLMGDGPRLRQILLNLLGNALKFTEQGHCAIRVSLDSSAPKQEATDQSAPTDYHLLFEVEDTGIGISEADQAKLFSEFSQVDASTTRKYGGTGLGLAITKRLIELMGGKIALRSQLGKGSCFYFTVQLQSHRVQPELEAPKKERNQATSRHGRVLLVEDNLVNQKIAIALLNRREYAFDLAHNGQEALQLLQANSYDLVLMDMQMPEMDGISATKNWREYEQKHQLATVPIIALTANVMESDQQLCLAVGMNDFIGKPFKPDTFYAVIERYLPN